VKFFSSFFFVVFLVGAGVTEARVFDMNAEKFAGYFKAQYAPSVVKQTAFALASNNGEVYDNSLTTLYGGEFGFIYSSRFINMRFGIEAIRPPTLKVNATNTGGTALYEVDSDVSVVIPKVGFEFNIRQRNTSRFFLNVNYGQGNLGLVNTYTFAAAGTALTGKTDYTEDGRGSAMNLDGALAYETLLADSTTMVIDVGYRSLKFPTITHNRDVNNISQGSVTKGTQMLNADGSARGLDFTGYYASLMFRFWVY
jgi:hypothetical protein